MDYTNYSSPSYSNQIDDTRGSNLINNNDLNPSNHTVRTIEPNRSSTESTETRLYGAFRNANDKVIQPTNNMRSNNLNDTVPTSNNSSTNDSPLIYPIDLGGNEALLDATTPVSPQSRTTQRANTQASIPTPDFMNRTQSMTSNTNGFRPYVDTPDQPMSSTQPINRNSMQRNTQPSTNRSQNVYPPTYSETMRNLNYRYQNRTDMPSNMMMYPMYAYDNTEQAERDLQYMKQLYPSACKRIQQEISRECDKLEYEGSIMYDEYPDRETMEHIIDIIYDRLKDLDDSNQQSEPNSNRTSTSPNEYNYDETEYQGDMIPNPPEITATGFGPFYPGPGYCPSCQNNWFRNTLNVMFYNELFNRRRRHYNHRFWF